MFMISSVYVENAFLSDAGEILALQKAAFLGQAKIYNNFQLPPLVETMEAMVAEFETRTFLKAVFQNRIIASVKYCQSGSEVHIGRLIVHPDFQNRGLGAYLMECVEDRFQNVKSYHLFTGSKSERNLHLYTKLGYRKVKTETNRDGVQMVYMAKLSSTGDRDSG